MKLAQHLWLLEPPTAGLLTAGVARALYALMPKIYPGETPGYHDVKRPASALWTDLPVAVVLGTAFAAAAFRTRSVTHPLFLAGMAATVALFYSIELMPLLRTDLTQYQNWSLRQKAVILTLILAVGAPPLLWAAFDAASADPPRLGELAIRAAVAMGGFVLRLATERMTTGELPHVHHLDALWLAGLLAHRRDSHSLVLGMVLGMAAHELGVYGLYTPHRVYVVK